MTITLNRPVRRRVDVPRRFSELPYVVTIDRVGITLRPYRSRTPFDVLTWAALETIAADRTARRKLIDKRAARVRRAK